MGISQANEWNDDANARRCALIDKDLDGAISDDEREELAKLTADVRTHADRVAPISLAGEERLLRELLSKGTDPEKQSS